MKNKWELLLPPLTWVVRKPSRYEVDSSLLKAIRASHIVVSACDTVTFPGDCMLLFTAMPMGLGHGRDDKGKKVHICAKHSQASTNHGTRLVTEHTNEYKYIRHAGLSFDNLLTWQEDLVRVLFLVTAPFRKQNHFGKIYGSIPTARHVCKRHVNRKASNYQRCSIFTASALTTRFQSCDKSTCRT